LGSSSTAGAPRDPALAGPGSTKPGAASAPAETAVAVDTPIPPSRETASAPAPALKAVTGSSSQTLREIEMQVIYQTLERLSGNKPKAAEELGISLKTLYNKLNQSQGPLEKSA